MATRTMRACQYLRSDAVSLCHYRDTRSSTPESVPCTRRSLIKSVPRYSQDHRELTTAVGSHSAVDTLWHRLGQYRASRSTSLAAWDYR
eukprot:210063-Rhodomonas_salina.4